MRSFSTDRQSSVDRDHADQRSRSFSLPLTLDYAASPPGYPFSSSGYSSTSSRTPPSYPQIPPPSRHQPFAASATFSPKDNRLDTRYYTLRPLEGTTFEPVALEESWELIPSIPLQSRTVPNASQNGFGPQALGNCQSPRFRCSKTSRRKERPQKLYSAPQAPKMSKLARMLRTVQREEKSCASPDAYISSGVALKKVGTEERSSNTGHELGSRALRFAPETYMIMTT
ncbi:hypothetical protein GGG16DRAFT_110457 [Schizophyllum commune]